MGLFDKLKGNSPEVKLSPKGALALASMTVIAADGSIDEDEIAGLRRIVRGDENAFNQAYKVFKNRPIADSVEIVNKFLSDKQKACVLANLIDLAMADGVMAGAEEKLLTSYISSFQLPDDTVKKIIEATEIKNNFSVFN
jgi:uncharacterized tellurite resistance protein B-like protein